MDTNTILSIPLGSFPQLDKLVWHHSNDGAFSVKSAYNVAETVLKSLRRQAALHNFRGQQINDPVWKQVWKIQVPNKLKVFLWKALQNGLAVGSNLARRVSDFNSQCPTCQDEEETVMHLFSICPKSRQVWSLSPLALRSVDIPGGKFTSSSSQFASR